MARKDSSNCTTDGVTEDVRPRGAFPPEANQGVLERELRNLYDSYGDDSDIPDRLVDLARKVAAAYDNFGPVEADLVTVGSRERN